MNNESKSSSKVITLDGPTSSGKTSVGYLFAKKIGFHYIDSGAIYRAGSLAALKLGMLIDDEEALAKVFSEIKLEFKEIDGKQHTFLNDEDVSEILHNPEVTSVVPIIAAFLKVRTEATFIKRGLAEKMDMVMAGRDIGTVIFPDAKLKFYLTADIQIRAQRRLVQLRKKIPLITYEEVLEQMIERDKADMIRKVSPLRIPEDAVIIDTTTLTADQTVEKMLTIYNEKYKS